MTAKHTSSNQRRTDELVDFLQDVALGKREATDQEITDAAEELERLMPGPPTEIVK